MSNRSISLNNDRKKNKKKSAENSVSIEEQVANFLKSGGSIEKVESGVSGMESMATRQPKSLQKSPKKSKPDSE